MSDETLSKLRLHALDCRICLGRVEGEHIACCDSAMEIVAAGGGCADLDCQRERGHDGLHMSRSLGFGNTEIIDEWGELPGGSRIETMKSVPHGAVDQSKAERRGGS